MYTKKASSYFAASIIQDDRLPGNNEHLGVQQENFKVKLNLYFHN